MQQAEEALVIGCGVIGLSTAIRLQEAGWRVYIWTAALPEQTTSSVAAAIWYPYKAYPEDRVLSWGSRAYQVFTELLDDPASGVLLREGVELWRVPMPDPWWQSALAHVGRCEPEDLPPGYRDGYLFTAPVIVMPIYLRYLLDRFVANGGSIEQHVVESIDQAATESRLIINCTGLGARKLFGDEQLMPIRGQIVRVRNPGVERFVLDEEAPEGVTYIVPRSEDCVLGGTADEGDWSLTPDPVIAASIVRRCIALEPRLKDAEILEHKVGLRPGRPTVRLEREVLANGAICVHNYGHGGSGVTLSWGCAEEAVALARQTA